MSDKLQLSFLFIILFEVNKIKHNKIYYLEYMHDATILKRREDNMFRILARTYSKPKSLIYVKNLNSSINSSLKIANKTFQTMHSKS
jgi:hypothetical protein